MRNLFAGKAFQAFGNARPIAGQGVGGPVPLAGAPQGQGQAQARGKALPVAKAKGSAMPGKSSFSGDCPICH